MNVAQKILAHCSASSTVTKSRHLHHRIDIIIIIIIVIMLSFHYLRRRLASGEGIVTLGITLLHCVCRRISLGGEGNAL